MAAIKWLRIYHAMIATPLTERGRVRRPPAVRRSRASSPPPPPISSVDRRLRRRHLAGGAARRPGRGADRDRLLDADGGARRRRVEDDRTFVDHLPLPDRADVPVLGDVLPGLAAAARVRAGGLGDADLARRRALPDADARARSSSGRRSATSPTCSRGRVVGFELARRVVPQEAARMTYARHARARPFRAAAASTSSSAT